MQLPETEMLDLPGGPARVVWRRNARARRVTLRIDPCGGDVVVTLPPRAGRGAGMALLMDHAGWVADRLAALPSAMRFVDGAVVPIAGIPHRIRHMPNGRGGAWLQDGELLVSGDSAFLPRRVRDFMRAEARRRFVALAAVKSASIGHLPRRVTVKDTSSRWGSCAPDGSLAFCWRLVMAPDFVQDYVAAHEVAHLCHMNHGPRFWDLVSRLTPHTETAMAWLRSDGGKLMRAG